MNPPRSALFFALRTLALLAALSALPGFADEYSNVSQLLRSSKFSEALTLADRFLLTKPADPQMRFFKGVIQRNLGKPTEAIETFTRLTEDYPELPEPYNNLAVLYAGQGQYATARVALEMAIRTNPSYATAHENIGDVYSRLASQAYNKALQLDNSNPAVPPKLALIREIFKPNLPANAPASPAPSAAATTNKPAVVAAASKPTAVAAASKPAAVPVPVPVPVAAAAAAAAASKPAVVAVAAASKPAVVAVAAASAVALVTAQPVAVVTTPVASAAKPAPAPPPVANAAATAAVKAWANAWAAKNMAGYLAAYSPKFVPPAGLTRAAWENDRTARITGKTSISVVITDLKLVVNGNRAVARFHQAYKADAVNVVSRKTLELQKSGGRWLITQEATGN